MMKALIGLFALVGFGVLIGGTVARMLSDVLSALDTIGL